ncbi:hypothetical protein LOD99_12946 [Oopsacas minuta]|uniref:Uncharacterized protein n=1 Tax=Oopsacas minuta TaxID=111878 RepID=A0AAV7J9I0_9METZ|nr:hypothetical protein LOD99_12946 [Oopsacas minuta]
MSKQTFPMDEEVLEYSPLHTSTSLSKLVDCQGQSLDTCEQMESSFMEFLESVRIRVIESGTDMSHVEDSIVELVQSTEEYQQVKQLVSELMNRNQSLDKSLSQEHDNKIDYEIRANQLEHELTLMREQLELVIKEYDETNQLLDWNNAREKQLVELQKFVIIHIITPLTYYIP